MRDILEVVRGLRIAMLDRGEKKFTFADIGGLGDEAWHAPYLLVQVEFFDTLEDLKYKLSQEVESEC